MSEQREKRSSGDFVDAASGASAASSSGQSSWVDPWATDGFERRRRTRHPLGVLVRVGLGTGSLVDMALLEVSAEGCSLKASTHTRVAIGDACVVGFRDAAGQACTASGRITRSDEQGVLGASFDRRNDAFVRWLEELGPTLPWIAA